MPMKDDRLRVARICRVPTQRSLLGASRFLRFRSVRRLELSPRSIFGGLSELGASTRTFAQVDFWWPQRARAWLHSRCDFVSNPGRAFFLLPRPVIV